MKKSLITLNGQSLFELVIAIGVSALIIVVLVSLVNNALQNSAFSKNEALASHYAQAATEWLRGQRDNNLSAFITNASSVPLSWCLIDDPLTDASWNRHNTCGSNKITGSNLFTRQVNFTINSVTVGGVPKSIYEAEVVVSWDDSKGTHKVNSSTQFSDWRDR